MQMPAMARLFGHHKSDSSSLTSLSMASRSMSPLCLISSLSQLSNPSRPKLFSSPTPSWLAIGTSNRHLDVVEILGYSNPANLSLRYEVKTGNVIFSGAMGSNNRIHISTCICYQNSARQDTNQLVSICYDMRTALGPVATHKTTHASHYSDFVLWRW